MQSTGCKIIGVWREHHGKQTHTKWTSQTCWDHLFYTAAPYKYPEFSYGFCACLWGADYIISKDWIVLLR